MAVRIQIQEKKKQLKTSDYNVSSFCSSSTSIIKKHLKSKFFKSNISKKRSAQAFCRSIIDLKFHIEKNLVPLTRLLLDTTK
jgi:hypothetical protein